MGLKSMFKKKEPTEAEIRSTLEDIGVTTKSSKKSREKFGQFKEYANERSKQMGAFKPIVNNPYANTMEPQAENVPQNSNPYANAPAPSNPYSQSSDPRNPPQQQGRGAPNPYQNMSQQSQQPQSQAQGQPYRGHMSQNGYQNNRSQNANNRQNAHTNSTTNSHFNPSSRDNSDAQSVMTDFNDLPSEYVAPNRRKMLERLNNREEDDFNALPEEDDFNELPEEELDQEQIQLQEENEEVEAIKGQIRFTKQESLASTRNILQMAQDSYQSGTNTLGVLGAQSEQLAHVENNLLLSSTQTDIANQKIKDLKHYNRSIFNPSVSNPFNKKSKLAAKEAKIKTEKEQEKYMKEQNRSELYSSQQRISNQLREKSSVNQKYSGERHLEQAKRYQFENDSEDDEIEKEIGSNLDEIDNFAKKLKNLAITTGEEVDNQNARLRKIEEDADKLDINVHMNSVRLNNIR